jgi:predicted methyltransferase
MGHRSMVGMKKTSALFAILAAIVGVSTLVVCTSGLDISLTQGRAQAQTADPSEVDAEQLVRVMHLQKGATIADIGAGGGYFTVALAIHVGDDVQVIATDLKSQRPPLLKGLKNGGSPRNVRVVDGAVAETNLPDGSCDALVVRRTYHHLFQPVEMAKSFLRTLRPGGRLFVIETPLMRMQPVPPDTPAFREGDGIMPSVLIKELSDVGFVYERTIQDMNPAQPTYVVVMRRP